MIARSSGCRHRQTVAVAYLQWWCLGSVIAYHSIQRIVQSLTVRSQCPDRCLPKMTQSYQHNSQEKQSHSISDPTISSIWRMGLRLSHQRLVLHHQSPDRRTPKLNANCLQITADQSPRLFMLFRWGLI